MRVTRILALAALAALAALLGACSGSGGGNSVVQDSPEGEWLKGDLHLHSHHSLDAQDNPMHLIVDQAEQRGMDYFVVTDHDNHVDGVIATWDDPDYRSEAMILLYGAEFTSAKGHANFFAPARYDHLALYRLRDGEGAVLGAATAEQGVHLSANHPTNSDPWLYGYDGGVDSLEIWNALFRFPSDNREVLNLWDSLLESGMRLPGRGGSDCHHQEGIQPLGLNVGTPTTWVYATERSAEAVIAALERGRASISYAPGAERVGFEVDADGDGHFEAMMGDNLPATGEPVEFRVTIDGFRPLASYRVDILRNGGVVETLRPLQDGSMRFTDTPPAGERSFYRVEVSGNTPEAETPAAALIGFYGRMIGLTNPIYFGY